MSRTFRSASAHAILAILMLCIAVLDWISGQNISLWFIYLLPITMASAIGGFAPGILFAFAAFGLITCAGYAVGHPFPADRYFYFSIFGDLIAYLAVVWLVALLRKYARANRAASRAGFPQSAGQLQLMLSAACSDMSAEWTRFVDSPGIEKGLPLAERLEVFVHGLRPFVDSRYPLLSPGSNGMFWLTTLTAIVESGTHSRADVSAAIADLQTRYLRN